MGGALKHLVCVIAVTAKKSGKDLREQLAFYSAGLFSGEQ